MATDRDEQGGPLHSTNPNDVAEVIAGQVRDAATGARSEVRNEAVVAAARVKGEAESVAENLRMEALDVARGLQRTMKSLADQMINLAGEMKNVQKESQRNKTLVRVLVVSMIFDVILSLVLGYTVYRQHQESERVTANTVNANQACMDFNQQNANQITLWGYIIDLSKSTSNTSPEQLAQFEEFLNTTFAPRPCPPAGPTPINDATVLWLGPLVLVIGGGTVVLVNAYSKRRAARAMPKPPADIE